MSYKMGPIQITVHGDRFKLLNSGNGDFNTVTFSYPELIRLRSLLDAAIEDHRHDEPEEQQA
ncbi:hypothetical protein [Pararhizobium arenae]|uniref:hypothetical protein n=1 Tax=Pararhizobium arenae TaxID=1856850 RepID=UPI00117AA8D8|nr:hypothetical protein [Pararhizobium arenae]